MPLFLTIMSFMFMAFTVLLVIGFLGVLITGDYENNWGQLYLGSSLAAVVYLTIIIGCLVTHVIYAVLIHYPLN